MVFWHQIQYMPPYEMETILMNSNEITKYMIICLLIMMNQTIQTNIFFFLCIMLPTKILKSSTVKSLIQDAPY